MFILANLNLVPSFRQHISCSWDVSFVLSLQNMQCCLEGIVANVGEDSFLLRKSLFSFYPSVGKYVGLLKQYMYILSDNKMTGLGPNDRNGDLISLHMSKFVVVWKDTEPVHNLIRHPLLPGRDMGGIDTGTHCESTINTAADGLLYESALRLHTYVKDCRNFNCFADVTHL